MKRLLIGCLLIVWAGAAAGQIRECVDAKGKKEFAQSCPPGTVKETTLSKGGAGPSNAATAPGTKSASVLEAEFRKRNLERQEADAKAEKDKAEATNAQRNCTSARAQMKQLQDGARIVRTDPNTGERSYLEDKERPAEIANAQKAVDSWCNSKK